MTTFQNSHPRKKPLQISQGKPRVYFINVPGDHVAVAGNMLRNPFLNEDINKHPERRR